MLKLEYPIKRRKCRVIKIGEVLIGGGFPIAVQSMTTTDTRDVEATVTQINQLYDAGCDIVRISVLNHDASHHLKKIRQTVDKSRPLVADIHFQYKLALNAIEAGFEKIRINPGNIGAEWKVREVTKAANHLDLFRVDKIIMDITGARVTVHECMSKSLISPAYLKAKH